MYVHVEQGESNDKNETKKKTNKMHAKQNDTTLNTEVHIIYAWKMVVLRHMRMPRFLGVFEAYAYASKTPKNSMHMPQKRHKFQYAYASKTPKISFDIYSLLHLECIQSHSPSSI